MSEINTNELTAVAAAATAAKVNAPLTKEEKIAKIDEQIAKLQARREDILADRQPVKAVAKKQYVPEVGAEVLATVGRNTPTSQAKVVPGVVVAVKAPAEGTKGAAQLRIRIYAGTFDEQLVTLYPAQVQAVRAESEGTVEAAAE